MPLNNFLHSFGFICRLPRVGLSTTSCVYVVSISDFPLHPCASQQLPASIRFQYLCIPCLSATSCAHLVSIPYLPRMCLSSNFLNFRASISILPLLHNFLRSYCFHNFLHASCFNIQSFPHLCLSANSIPAFMQFQYLGVSPSTLHSFLHASSFRFNI